MAHRDAHRSPTKHVKTANVCAELVQYRVRESMWPHYVILTRAVAEVVILAQVEMIQTVPDFHLKSAMREVDCAWIHFYANKGKKE